jgi:hypothetical protein
VWGKTNRWNTQFLYFSEIISCDATIVDACHYTFFQAHKNTNPNANPDANF